MALASMRRTTRCTVRPTMVRAGRSPKNGGGLSASGITMAGSDGEDGHVEQLGDELLGVERSVTDEHVERELRPDVRDVLEVVLDAG